jgi:NADH-quinone oxidoreductase subunit A
MDHPFFPILIVLLFGATFAAIFLGLSSLIGPKKPNDSKLSVYECGLKPIGDARDRIDIKFSLVALLFILFDIEAIFLFPWALVFKDFIDQGNGLFMLIEMGVFILILGFGLIYIWRKKALEWR